MTGHGARLVVTMVVVLAACERAPSSKAPTVRDSAGVAIVEHGAVDVSALPRYELSPEPLLRIGTVDGDEAYQFATITDATLRPDGSVAVLDRSRTLRVFDSTGTLRWTTGRSGDGPGEFRAALRIASLPGSAPTGDTLLVWDVALGRLSSFVEPIGLVHSVRAAELAGRAEWLGPLRDGSALFEQRQVERTTVNARAAVATRSALLRSDSTRAQFTSLGTYAQVVQYQEGGSDDGAFSPAIFAGIVRFAATEDGYWVGDPDYSEVRQVRDSSVHRIVRWRGPDRTVATADVEALKARYSADAQSVEQRDALERYFAHHPVAERFPAFDMLLVAADGALWVRDAVREHTDDDMRRWTRFSSDGTALQGRLEHRAALRVLRIASDRVLAVERDALDVEQLVVYRRRAMP
jgi:hypothetical protein